MRQEITAWNNMGMLKYCKCHDIKSKIQKIKAKMTN